MSRLEQALDSYYCDNCDIKIDKNTNVYTICSLEHSMSVWFSSIIKQLYYEQCCFCKIRCASYIMHLQVADNLGYNAEEFKWRTCCNECLSGTIARGWHVAK